MQLTKELYDHYGTGYLVREIGLSRGMAWKRSQGEQTTVRKATFERLKKWIKEERRRLDNREDRLKHIDDIF